MRRTGSVSNSISFIKYALNFLMNNKDLMIFPFISILASLSFIALGITGGAILFETLSQLQQTGIIIGVALLILAYFILSFIIIFFSASLYACTLGRLSGQIVTLRAGMLLASKHWQSLLGWSIVSTTVGLVLQALENLHNTIADIISFILGISWSVTTYFVLPTLILNDVGPIKAIKQAGAVFGKGWRKTIRVNFILSFIMMIIVGLIYLVVHYTSTKNIVFDEIMGLIIGVTFILLIILNGVFNCIITSGLYLSIVKKQDLPGLEKALVESAFCIKKK